MLFIYQVEENDFADPEKLIDFLTVDDVLVKEYLEEHKIAKYFMVPGMKNSRIDL